MTATTPVRPDGRSVERRPRPHLARSHAGYLGAVLLGIALTTVTALSQPFNQNELLQMAPYAEGSLEEITGATRQPPLDPLLGALAWRLFGEGQLQQRLVPLLAGAGTLVVVALLLRRLGVGVGGPLALLVLAVSPLFVRFSAYSRPYALPVLLLVVFVYAAHRWLTGGGRGWFALAGVAAVLAPLARVPESMAFLAVTAVVLLWLTARRTLPWRRSVPMVGAVLVGLLAVALPLAVSVARRAPSFVADAQTDLGERFRTGAAEMAGHVAPLLAQWLPWWPATVGLVVVAAALPDARRRLAAWWFFWPLLGAPVAAVLFYHFGSDMNLDTVPYKARSAYFFAVPFALLVAAVLAGVARVRTRAEMVRRAAVLTLVAGVLVGSAPATAEVLLHNDAPDYAAAAQLIHDHVPDDALVLADRPTAPEGGGRQSFLGRSRYLEDDVRLRSVGQVLRHPMGVPHDRPVYLLVNGDCIRAGCDEPTGKPWRGHVPGFRLAGVADRFSLYEPAAGQAGRRGAAALLEAAGDVLGPRVGYVETLAAAAMYDAGGHDREASRVVQELLRRTPPRILDDVRAATAEDYGVHLPASGPDVPGGGG